LRVEVQVTFPESFPCCLKRGIRRTEALSSDREGCEDCLNRREVYLQ
jgi:hypothetical protein